MYEELFVITGRWAAKALGVRWTFGWMDEWTEEQLPNSGRAIDQSVLRCPWQMGGVIYSISVR